MKKLVSLLLLIACMNCFNEVEAAFNIKPAELIHGGPLYHLRVADFIHVSAKDYSRLTGKKMNLKERIAFSFEKIKMKQAIKKNKNLTMGEYYDSSRKLGTGWLILIIVGGLFLIVVMVFLISGGLDIGV